MFKPSVYDSVYPFSYIFTYIVTVPHALLTQLAYPNANGVQGVLPCCAAACQLPTSARNSLLRVLTDMLTAANVFGVVPKNVARDVSIILMVIHEASSCLRFFDWGMRWPAMHAVTALHAS